MDGGELASSDEGETGLPGVRSAGRGLAVPDEGVWRWWSSVWGTLKCTVLWRVVSSRLPTLARTSLPGVGGAMRRYGTSWGVHRGRGLRSSQLEGVLSVPGEGVLWGTAASRET